MSYRLIKSQIGGSNCEILILIAVIVVAWFLFVQSNSPKKEKFDLTESYTPINAQLKSSSPSSTVAEEESIYDSPAVDLSAPGVPYLPLPRHFNPPSASKEKNDLKNKKRVDKKLVSSKKNSPVSISFSTKSAPPLIVVSSPSNDSRVGSPPYDASVASRSEPGYGSSEDSTMSPGLSVASSPNTIPVMTVVSESDQMNKRKSSKKSSKKSKENNSSKKKIEKFTDVNKLYSVRDSYDLKTPLTKSTCSQKCCGYYWKENMDGLFKKDDPVKWSDVGVGKKYRTSNVSCMGDGVAPPGCRCHTGDQYELLATRGGNGSRNY